MATDVISAERVKAQKGPIFFKSKKFMERFNQSLSTIIIGLGAVFILIPVVWMFSSSLKVKSNVNAMPPSFIPRQAAIAKINGEDLFIYTVILENGETKDLAAVKLDPLNSKFVDPNDPTQVYYAPASQATQKFNVVFHWENFATVWTNPNSPFMIFMKNTFIYAVVAVIGEVLSCSFVAFGFARLRAPGKDILFVLILATLMLPYAVLMIPQYVLFTRYIPDIINGLLGTHIKLADSWWPLMVPKFFGSAYLIFLIRQFYMSIPKDYDEAARIDGASFLRTWWEIILPMSRPVLVAVAVLSFMYHWNDYMGPLIYINSTSKQPMSVGLTTYNATYQPSTNLLMGASLIAVLPLVIIFFFLNRYFIQGVVVSGIKG